MFNSTTTAVLDAARMQAAGGPSAIKDQIVS
jgi:hypothetical protein